MPRPSCALGTFWTKKHGQKQIITHETFKMLLKFSTFNKEILKKKRFKIDTADKVYFDTRQNKVANKHFDYSSKIIFLK